MSEDKNDALEALQDARDAARQLGEDGHPKRATIIENATLLADKQIVRLERELAELRAARSTAECTPILRDGLIDDLEEIRGSAANALTRDESLVNGQMNRGTLARIEMIAKDALQDLTRAPSSTARIDIPAIIRSSTWKTPELRESAAKLVQVIIEECK